MKSGDDDRDGGHQRRLAGFAGLAYHFCKEIDHLLGRQTAIIGLAKARILMPEHAIADLCEDDVLLVFARDIKNGFVGEQ